MAFTAKFEGTCARNRDTIFRGDLVEYDRNDRLVHVECDIEIDARADADPDDFDRDEKRPVCPACFMLKPCECDDL